MNLVTNMVAKLVTSPDLRFDIVVLCVTIVIITMLFTITEIGL